MAKVLLTDSRCEMASKAASELPSIAAYLKQCSNNMKSIITDPNIKEYITDTDFGKSLNSDIERYCESLKNLATALEDIKQSTIKLVNESREANANKE